MTNDNKIRLGIILIIFVPAIIEALKTPRPISENLLFWIFTSMVLFLAFALIYNPDSVLGQRIKIGVLLIPFAGLSLSLLWHYIPANLNEQEKAYMEHFNAGYKCFQNDDYACSIREYELAENIFDTDVELYVRKAWTYQYLKQYEKAIETARKGLQLDESKSIYKKAHKFGMGILQSDISLYETIGKSHYYLKQYQEAKEAYNYLVNHSTYKYSNYHLWRGICEYYLGEKQNALNDFYRYRDMITDSLQNPEKNELSPFTQKDLTKVEKWIMSAQAL